MGISILFISANSPADRHIDIEDEQRGVQESLKAARHRDHFAVVFVPAIRADELPTYLSNESPAVVHFAGHSWPDGFIFRGSDVPISGVQLTEAFRNRGVRLVVLNSCFSLDLAEAINNVVPSVVGTTKALDDHDAVRFSARLYRGLGDGHTVGEAFRDARDAVGLTGGEDVFKTVGDMNQVFASQQDIVASRQDVVASRPRWFKFTMSFTVTIAVVLVAAVVMRRDYGTEPPLTMAPDTRAEPSIVPPLPLAGFTGRRTLKCQMPNPSAKPAAVHVWAVPYVNAEHTEWSRPPFTSYSLTQSESDPFAWTGTVSIDPQRGLGFGFFVLCHASFDDDPVLDDEGMSRITNAAKRAGRTMDR